MLADKLRSSPITSYLSQYKLYSWGDNVAYQLGDGTATDRSSPVQVGSPITDAMWSEIAAGSSDGTNAHSLAIDNNKNLWAWGENSSGELGIGNTNDRSSPNQVGSDKWSKISAGLQFSHAMRVDGTLWGWGNNVGGTVGDSTFTNRSSPVQIMSSYKFKAISGRSGHCLAIMSDGTLWAWGNDVNGETGLGLGPPAISTIETPTQVNYDSDWSKIDTGYQMSFAIKLDGTLWAWGLDAFGGLGLNGAGSGQGYESVPVQVGASTNWKTISAGGFHTLALRTNGTLWSWGYNANGQLGHNDTTDRSSPTQIGSATDWVDISAGDSFSLAIKSDGSLYGWGYNDQGQLGDGSTTTRLTPRQIGTNTIKYRNIDAGWKHSMGLRE